MVSRENDGRSPPVSFAYNYLLADVSAFFRWPAIDRPVNCPHDGVKLTEIDVQGSARLRLPRALSMTAKSARLPSLSRPMVAICRTGKDYPRDNDAPTKWTIQRNSLFTLLPRSHPHYWLLGGLTPWQIDTTPLDFCPRRDFYCWPDAFSLAVDTFRNARGIRKRIYFGIRGVNCGVGCSREISSDGSQYQGERF